MRLVKLLLVTSIFSLIPGQLVRVFINPTSALTISDMLVFTLNIVFVSIIISKKLPLKLPGSVFTAGAFFLIWALSSTIFALNFYAYGQVLISAFFILRLAIYFALATVVINVVKRNEIDKYVSILLISGLVFAICGIIQFVIFPNLTSLQLFGWDPHTFRLVSTTLDPNYTGAMLTIFAAFSTCLYLYKKNLKYLFLSLLFTTCVLLTFSRSSYLAYLVTMAAIGLVKSPRVIILALALFLFAFAISSQVRDRIIGAFLIDKTASARIESWQKALTVFAKNPVFGVGFNTYRYAQLKYGFFQDQGDSEIHSGAGSDSTILLIAATTGTVGLVLFLGLLTSLLLLFKKNVRENYLALAATASFFGLLVHTQFVNSLLYPQIMLLLWLLVGLKYANDN